MSANSVSPPLGFTTRAESSEYFAGIARNELSECQSMLPRLNMRWRLSRGSGLPSLPRFDTSFMPLESRLSSGLGDVAAARVLQRAEVAREGHLLLVGELLVAEHQHGVAVHAGLDGSNVLEADGPGDVDAGYFPGENRTDLADHHGHGHLLAAGRPSCAASASIRLSRSGSLAKHGNFRSWHAPGLGFEARSCPAH